MDYNGDLEQWNHRYRNFSFNSNNRPYRCCALVKRTKQIIIEDITWDMVAECNTIWTISRVISSIINFSIWLKWLMLNYLGEVNNNASNYDWIY